MKSFVAMLGLAGAMILPLAGQSVISVKAGLIHYVEGSASINDKDLVLKPSQFPDLKNGEVLRTTEGRVEMLLAPGSILRLPENSAVKMESNALLATRLAMVEGSALIEVTEIDKNATLEVLMGSEVVTVRKAGLYKFDIDNPSVKVFKGELAVNYNNNLVKVGEGRVMTLTGDHLVAKFDKDSGDEFSRWASRRSQTLAMANTYAAKSAGRSLTSSSWYWNPFFNMYTFVPLNGYYSSPFGWGFYSPVRVGIIYNNPGFGYYGGGTAGRGSSVSYNPTLGYNSSISRQSAGSPSIGLVGSSTGAARSSGNVSFGGISGGGVSGGGARGGGAVSGGGMSGGGGVRSGGGSARGH